MTRRGRPAGRWTALLAATLAASLLAPACRQRDAAPSDPDGSPQALARALFAAATAARSAPADGDAVTRVEPLLEHRPDDRLRAALGDALDEMRAPGGIEVVETGPLPGGRVAVEVAARLDGDGEARWTVWCRQVDGGAWRLLGFAGPGADWPPRPASPDDGLSVSSPPPEAGPPPE